MPKVLGFARLVENQPGWDVAGDELEFLQAIEAYQRQYGRRYPTWREVLFVARCLGYRKVAPRTPLPRAHQTLPPFLDAPPTYPA